ncbi:hypothetical protein DVH24_021095 [Malus domestica]|uniref:Uncharacterized protein n=1 Tax=Malus domestica TaxID=3750 RepID=A0A498JEA9_MALDO|nr:hypothetical protein DVH24_021095 [Malus domestica]
MSPRDVGRTSLMQSLTWSVYTEITLIRDLRRRKDDITLGKANEGVLVLLLVWDDMTSIEELKNDGLMTTHYQETKAYFRNTKVRSFLCPRNPDEGKSETVTMFSHHQKTVVVDSEIFGGGSQRRIIGTVMSHGDMSMAARSRGVGRHSCESRAGAGLGQALQSGNAIQGSPGMIFIANWKNQLLRMSCATLSKGGKNRLDKCS